MLTALWSLKGVTKRGAEERWGSNYVIFRGMLKIRWNKVNALWKAWPVLALKCNSDNVLQPGISLLPRVRHDLSKGQGFFVGPEITHIPSSVCGSETVDVWLEWQLIAPGSVHGTRWSHFPCCGALTNVLHEPLTLFFFLLPNDGGIQRPWHWNIIDDDIVGLRPLTFF